MATPITLEILVDTVRVSKDLSDLKKRLDDLNNTARQAARDMKQGFERGVSELSSIKAEARNASASVRSIGESAKQTNQQLRGMAKEFRGTYYDMMRLGQVVSGVFGAGMLSRGVGELINTAQDAQENIAKFNYVFNDTVEISKKANNALSELKNDYRVASRIGREMLSSTTNILRGYGMNASEATDMSTNIQKLAADLANFNNLQGGAARASQALTKALYGYRMAARRLGVSIYEASIKERVALLYRMGMHKSTPLATKAYATYLLMVEQSAKAYGTTAREAHQYLAHVNALRASWDDLKVTLGMTLIGPAQMVVDWLKHMCDLINNVNPRVLAFATRLGILAGATTGIAMLTGAFVSLYSTLKPLESLTSALSSVKAFFSATTLASSRAVDRETAAETANAKASFAASKANDFLTASKKRATAAAEAHAIALTNEAAAIGATGKASAAGTAAGTAAAATAATATTKIAQFQTKKAPFKLTDFIKTSIFGKGDQEGILEGIRKNFKSSAFSILNTALGTFGGLRSYRMVRGITGKELDLDFTKVRPEEKKEEEQEELKQFKEEQVKRNKKSYSKSDSSESAVPNPIILTKEFVNSLADAFSASFKSLPSVIKTETNIASTKKPIEVQFSKPISLSSDTLRAMGTALVVKFPNNISTKSTVVSPKQFHVIIDGGHISGTYSDNDGGNGGRSGSRGGNNKNDLNIDHNNKRGTKSGSQKTKVRIEGVGKTSLPVPKKINPSNSYSSNATDDALSNKTKTTTQSSIYNKKNKSPYLYPSENDHYDVIINGDISAVDTSSSQISHQAENEYIESLLQFYQNDFISKFRSIEEYHPKSQHTPGKAEIKNFSPLRRYLNVHRGSITLSDFVDINPITVDARDPLRRDPVIFGGSVKNPGVQVRPVQIEIPNLQEISNKFKILHEANTIFPKQAGSKLRITSSVINDNIVNDVNSLRYGLETIKSLTEDAQGAWAYIPRESRQKNKPKEKFSDRIRKLLKDTRERNRIAARVIPD